MVAPTQPTVLQFGRELDKERRFWLAVRRALFIAIQAIEERYDMPLTKAGK